MSKKRRPHKPAPSPRPGTPAPKAGNAPVADTDVAPPIADATEQSGAPTDVAAAAHGAVADEATAGFGAPGTTTAHASAASSASDDSIGSTGAAAAVGASPAQHAGRPTMPPAAPVAAEFVPATRADIRGVLIQVAGARLLLPNATIAEVLSYADPEPVGGNAPDWLLGRMRWRGWQLPLIAFGRLAGVAEENAALGSKVVVLKALAGTGRAPYFAMLTQGFPRLVTVSRGALALDDDNAEAMPRGVQGRVRLNENEALLPDLEAVEALVNEALEQAA